MKQLENLIFFTGENCTGCKVAKHTLAREGYEIELCDTGTTEGSAKARTYRVCSLPTFINTKTLDRLNGNQPIERIIKLNEINY